jgi:NADPH-dependent 2,4-dienoyl-CoA reductase/sulfur reductase-like enzyme
MHFVIIGGSDAGISAALRARELDHKAVITVVLADGYPNFSICGLPFFFERRDTRLASTCAQNGIRGH